MFPVSFVVFATTTGEYRFCSNAFTVAGQGTVTHQGTVYTLVHNAPDRKISATIDSLRTKGSASIQYFPAGRKILISDRNTKDSVCSCP